MLNKVAMACIEWLLEPLCCMNVAYYFIFQEVTIVYHRTSSQPSTDASVLKVTGRCKNICDKNYKKKGMILHSPTGKHA